MLSDKVLTIKESATLAMAQKAQTLKNQGIDIISMSLGEPDFDAPDFLKKAATEAIEKNYSKYTPVPGLLELRSEISKKFKRENNLDYSPEQIVVSNGAKQSIANLMISLLNPDDEILLPAPFWVSYFDMAKFIGAKVKIIGTNVDNDFKITPELLENSISENSKVFLFSNPCNPSGAMYSEEELRALGEVFIKYPKLQILSDEIYEYIVFGKKHFSIGSIEELKERVTTINGFSKGFAVTGWRIGYIGAPLEISKACSKIQSQFTSGANSISQKACTEAVKRGVGSVGNMIEAFHKRRDLFISLLNEKIPKFKISIPDGAFYLLPDVSAYFGKGDIKDSLDFSAYILEHANVAATPGAPFGAPNCIRFSYALSESDIEKAVNRIAESLKNL
jgi:aspartate aminotransferase